MIFWIIVI